MADPTLNQEDFKGAGSLLTLIVFVIFGGWGGVTRYLHIVSKNRRKFSVWEFICSWMVGGFSGVMFGMLARHFTQETDLLLFTAGATGVMGWKAIELLQFAITNKVKSVVGEEPE